MTDFPKILKDGFSNFHRQKFRKDQNLYETLATEGQSPKIMLIGCSDSRVDPMAIFNASPGDLFVVRNVANLVPPFQAAGQYSSVSSALEYGVKHLDVDHIVILGHTDCGGVKAMLTMEDDAAQSDSFISQWISMMAPTKDRVLKELGEKNAASAQHAMKTNAIQTSLENLESFAFISSKIAAGELQTHGAYYNIGKGQIYVLDKSSGAFTAL